MAEIETRVSPFVAFRDRLRVGQEAPDFLARDLEGGAVRLSDLRGKRNVVLEFGSITWPPFRAEVPPLEELQRQFQANTAFFTVYVREPHPGGRIPQTASYEERLANAAECRRQCGITMPILVDNMDEEIHKLYGYLPNMVYVIDKEGRVAYRADWTHAEEVGEVLERLRQAEEALAQGIRLKVSYSEKLVFSTIEEQMASSARHLEIWESYEDYDEPERFFGPERGRQMRELAALWRARAAGSR